MQHTAYRTLLAFLACSSIFSTASRRAGAQAPEQPLEAATHLVVMIGTPRLGAGILFGRAGDRVLLATAYHVVRPDAQASPIQVMLRTLPDRWLEARLEQANPELDLAVLSLDSLAAHGIEFEDLPLDRLGSATDLERGDAVYPLGYPNAARWAMPLTPDLVSQVAGTEIAFQSAFIQEGHSGGALLNRRGEIVGMIRADRPPFGVAVDFERILTQVRQWSYPVGLRYSLTARTQIAFMTDRNNDRAVLVMAPDGTRTGTLADQLFAYSVPITSYPPVWSPDGTRLAFLSARDDGVQLYTVHADGTGLAKLTDHPKGVLRPAWSPDGTHIAYVAELAPDSTIYARGDVYVINADGSNALNLTRHPEHDGNPAWSPDGKRITFTSWRDGNAEVYVMDTDGSNPVNLTRHPEHDGNPAWSPDGTRIAFIRSHGGSYDLYVMDADGANPVNLTNDPALEIIQPIWSPDGTRITFASDRDGRSFEIYAMNADGTGLVNLTQNPAAELLYSWSPDGSKIAFMTDRDGNYEIYVMGSDGANQIRLTDDAADDFAPAWSPFLK